MIDTKPWYKSKAMWGAVLIAAGTTIKLVGDFLSGNIDPGTMVNQIIPQIGIVIGIVGLRTAKTNIV
jgi:hypothetical protein